MNKKLKDIIIKIGDKLTRLGDYYNIRWLVYNPITWGRFLHQSRYNGCIFSRTVKKVLPEIVTSLDVGSGGGGYVYYLRKHGYDAEGIEYSLIGRILGLLQGLHIRKYNCEWKTNPFQFKQFDLVYSIEVGEHIPYHLSDSFVEYISNRGRVIVFSAAHPGQGGQGHINEQPKKFWKEKFEKHGFAYQYEDTKEFQKNLIELGYKGWLPENIQIFRSIKQIN